MIHWRLNISDQPINDNIEAIEQTRHFRPFCSQEHNIVFLGYMTFYRQYLLSNLSESYGRKRENN